MQVDRRLLFAGCVVVSLLICAPSGPAQAQATLPSATVIKQVEVSEQQGAASVRISGDGVLTARTERLPGPERLVLDFANARVSAVHPKVDAQVGPVRGVRVGQFSANVARVVVDLDSAAPFQIESGDGTLTVLFGTSGASAAESTGSPQRATAKSLPEPAVSSERATLLPAKANSSRAVLKPAVVTSSPANSLPSTPAAPAMASAASAAPPAMEVPTSGPNSYENGLLTFTAKDRPLELVLDDIGGITGVPIVLSNGLGSEHVSVQLRSFRLDEALRQVLKSYDFILSYSGDDSSNGDLTLHTVWVYPPNQGPGMGRFAMAAWNTSTRQYQQATSAADPDERARAVDELIRRDGRGAVSTVMDALRDPSDKVRYQAIYRAVLVGALPPEDTIIDLVLNDPSDQVKVWAFQTLPLDLTLRWVALRVSTDSNQQLAALARNYLNDLDASLGGNAVVQPAPDATPPAAASPAAPPPDAEATQPVARHPEAQPGPSN